MLKALNIFTDKFPELAFIHIPTFIKAVPSALSREQHTLLSAVLAVIRAQLPILKASWETELLDREQYASYAREMLTDMMLQPPKVEVAQSLLIITMYEWGTRDFHKAWVYCGKHTTMSLFSPLLLLCLPPLLFLLLILF